MAPLHAARLLPAGWERWKVLLGFLVVIVVILLNLKSSLWESSSNFRQKDGDILQNALGFSNQEMVYLYGALLEMKEQRYDLPMETCKSRLACAQRAFTRLLSRMHNSKILPLANRWWANGSFERDWIERFLSENALPLVKKGSRCLEWGTFYTEKIFSDVCVHKDSLEHSDTPQPPINSSIGLVYRDEIFKASTLPDNTFDVILSTQVYEHLYDPMLATKTMVRILKPGGILVATGPHLCPYHKAPDDYFRYTKSGIASILKRSGLTPIVERQFGNIHMLVNIFEGVPVKEVSQEDIYSTPDEAYAQWTIVARKPM